MDYCEALFLRCLRSKEWELIVSRLQPLHPGQWHQKHTRTCGQNFRNLYLQTRIFKPGFIGGLNPAIAHLNWYARRQVPDSSVTIAVSVASANQKAALGLQVYKNGNHLLEIK